MPTSVEAVVVLALFILPGFIAAVAYDRNAPRREVSDFRFLLQVAFWGALVHLVALPWTGGYFLQALREPNALLAVTTIPDLVRAGFVLLVLPAAAGAAAGSLLSQPRIQRALRMIGMSAVDLMPTAWDSAFKPGGKGAWLYVYIRDLKEPIIGEYGPDSVAGVSPSEHDLFLERRYQIKDGKLVPDADSAGVWIAEAQFIEFYRASKAGGQDEGKDRNRRG